MFKRLREERDEDGFTLIELMVVVLIISILIAIAIPTFLGAREGAQDRAAQSNLRNAHTAAKTLYADDGEWAPQDIDADGVDETVIEQLQAMEPSLAFQAAVPVAGDPSNAVGVTVNDTQELTLSSYSETGATYEINEVAQEVAPTVNAVGTWYQVDGAGWDTTAEDGW